MNITKKTSSIKPSALEIPEVKVKKLKINKRNAENIMKGLSINIVDHPTCNGINNEAIPRIKPIFAILLPTILPIEISELPCNAAKRLTDNSGKDVPKATSVNPIINGEMPKDRANFAEPLTKISAPPSKIPAPRINKIISNILLASETEMYHFYYYIVHINVYHS